VARARRPGISSFTIVSGILVDALTALVAGVGVQIIQSERRSIESRRAAFDFLLRNQVAVLIKQRHYIRVGARRR
jgi:hypothetical protein